MSEAPAATEAYQRLVDDFAYLGDWEERYGYVIDLGRGMPPIDESDRTEANKVDGCVSQVWLVPQIERGEGGQLRMQFLGDSDALITRGLIAVLRALYCGVPVEEVGAIDAGAALARLDLESHLSRQRSNGLQAMVKRVQALASGS